MIAKVIRDNPPLVKTAVTHSLPSLVPLVCAGGGGVRLQVNTAVYVSDIYVQSIVSPTLFLPSLPLILEEKNVITLLKY